MSFFPGFTGDLGCVRRKKSSWWKSTPFYGNNQTETIGIVWIQTFHRGLIAWNLEVKFHDIDFCFKCRTSVLFSSIKTTLINTIHHKNKQIYIRSQLQRKVMMMRDIDPRNCKFTLLKAGYFYEGSELIFSWTKHCCQYWPTHWFRALVKWFSRGSVEGPAVAVACDSDANIGCGRNWNVKLKVSNSENESE